MMKMKHWAIAVAGTACISSAAASDESINNFPTLTRVEYVLECLTLYDRPQQELVYKCTCAIDAIAKKIDHDQWIALMTFNKAAPIAGERGAYLRERKDIRTKVGEYRETQASARKACFLPEPKAQ